MKVKPQIILFLIFAIWIITNSSCQRISDDYLLGEWYTNDSGTGKREIVVFKKNKTLVFEDPRSEWIYSYKIQDSLIDLDYDMHTDNIDLQNGGFLLIQNDNCFWWFSDQAYEVYERRLGMDHHITMPDKFQLWLKDNRKVFYRVKRH